MPKYRKVKPEEIKKDDCFILLGCLWTVERVVKDGVSKGFHAYLSFCPAGYADCKVYFDIHFADQLKWLP